jgi:hypothetical protein
MSEKVIALLEGMQVSDPVYWSNRSEKELREMGHTLSNLMAIGGKKRNTILEALIGCADRLRLLEEKKRAKTLDILALMKADEVIKDFQDD